MTRAKPLSDHERRPDYERLVREHHAEVYGSAWRILRHEEDARDVAQEVFLEVLGAPARFAQADEPARVLRWLAARKALARLRGDRHRRGREEDRARMREERAGDEVVAEAEVRGILARELAELADELRCALMLRFGEGMSLAGVAESLGVSAPTARERVERGLERLRARLSRAGCAGVVPVLPELLAKEAPVAPPAGLEAGLLALGSGAAAAAKGIGSFVALGLAGVALAGVAVAAALLPSREDAELVGESALAAPPSVADGPSGAPAAGSFRIALVEPVEGEAPPVASIPATAQVPPTGRIVGRLVDAERRPVAGAELYASSLARDGKLPRYRAEGASADDGRFALDVPVEQEGGQRYRLIARHGSFITYRGPELVVELEAPLELGELELVRKSDDLAGAWTADLFLVDEDGVPVGGAVVTVERSLLVEEQPWDAKPEARGVTDAGGRVRLAGEWLGEKRARVVAEGQGFRAGRFEFAIARVGHDAFTFTLERGFSVTGAVRAFEDGGVPGGLQVYAVGRDKSRWIHARLLADGRFELSGLDVDDEYELYADAPAFSPARRIGLEPDAGELRFELKRRDDPRDVGDHMAELHGRVVDGGTGAPIAVDEFAVDEIWVAPEDVGRPAGWLLAHYRIGSMAQRMAQGIAREPESDFNKVGLRPATYVLRAFVRGYAPAMAGPFTLEEGALIDDIVLELEVGATLAGSVRDVSGAPVPEAFVWLDADSPDAATRLAGLDDTLQREDPRWLPRCVKADARGAFRFEHVPSGLAFRLGVVHLDHAPALGPPVEPTPGEERIGVELRAGVGR